MSVKRYDLVGDTDGNCNLNEARMELSDDGVYVKYSEHSLLEQKLTDMAVQLANAESKCRELAAENAGLKASIPPLKIINDVTDSWDDVSLAEEVGFNNAVSTILKSLPETPATDAFLAEVRAQGVEMFAIEWGGHDSPYGQDAYNFAAKIRKGAAL